MTSGMNQNMATAPSSSVLDTDFMADDEISLRDHTEAQVLINNPYDKQEQPKMNLVRASAFVPDDKDDFIKSSKVWRCLACIKLGDYSKYFNVTTTEVVSRLKYTFYGHYTGMQRPSFINEQTYQGLAVQSQEQIDKPDFDLYAPFWLMITLVVECSIIGLLNKHINAYFADDYDANGLLNENFSMLTVCNLFFFLSVFFFLPPLAIYFFARLKLLDSSTKYLRLFAALGYSYASYVPAILLTLVGVEFVRWIVILLACGNQLFGLYKQADHLVPAQNSI